MTDFYIGQIFDKTYPHQAAIWANANNAVIEPLGNGNYKLIDIPPLTQEKLRQIKIKNLKSKLTATDYICIKIAEGAATHAEYAEIIAQRQAWRAEINRLEQENEQTNGVNTGGTN